MHDSVPIATCALALGAAAFGCRSTAPIAHPLADHVSRRQVASTVWIGFPVPEGLSGYASAVVVGPRQLLTTAHGWSEDEPWWEHELPERRELVLLEPAVDGRLRFVRTAFRLVAAGDNPTEDWALLEADAPRWGADEIAFVHPSAGNHGWSVAEGTELFVAGFSSIFMENAAARDVEHVAAFVAGGPYTLVGEAVLVDGQPAVKYPADWPRPGGHSGGGVYLRATRALELVGVFHSWVPATTDVTRRYEPLGLSALAFERTARIEERTLFYAPLAPALRALWGDER